MGFDIVRWALDGIEMIRVGLEAGFTVFWCICLFLSPRGAGFREFGHSRGRMSLFCPTPSAEHGSGFL